MKTIILISSLFCLITGCSQNKQEPQKQENAIYAQWSLTRYEPGFSPTENFNIGEISWTFESTNNLQVQVINSINTPPLKTNGVYNFSINDSQIVIDDSEYDFSISGNTLIISDNPSSDGFRATFTKKTE